MDGAQQGRLSTSTAQGVGPELLKPQISSVGTETLTAGIHSHQSPLETAIYAKEIYPTPLCVSCPEFSWIPCLRPESYIVSSGTDRPFQRAGMANDGSVSFAVSLPFVSQTQFGCICLKKKAKPHLRLKKCQLCSIPFTRRKKKTLGKT